MRTLAPAATALLMIAAAAPPLAIDPDHIAWQRSNPDGTRFALLEGARDKLGTAFS